MRQNKKYVGHKIAYDRSAIKLKKCNLNVRKKKVRTGAAAATAAATAVAVDESVHRRMRWKIKINYASLVNSVWRKPSKLRANHFGSVKISLQYTQRLPDLKNRFFLLYSDLHSRHLYKTLMPHSLK